MSVSVRRVVIVVCASALASGPGAVAKAGEGASTSAESVAPHNVHEVRGGVLAAGVLTFGLSWVAAVVVGGFGWIGATVDNENCGDCGSQAKMMFVPLAGPLLAESRQNVRDLDFPTWTYWAWTGVQAAGLAMLVVGLVGHDVLETDRPPPRAAVTAVPLLTKGLAGLALDVAW